MILHYSRLSRHATLFHVMTGLTVSQFDALVRDPLPVYAAAEQTRLDRPDRQRAIGAGRSFALSRRDHLLMAVVWLRRSPINAVLGYLFGVEETTAMRTVRRVVPVLERLGLDTMRLPDPGRGKQVTLDGLLRETPGLAILVDTYAQPVQRHTERDEADRWYSGKKKRHTIKTQVAVDERDGRIVDVAPSVRGRRRI